jgi:uncharacterized Fe-S center protein
VNPDLSQPAQLDLPSGLVCPDEAFPTVFVDCTKADLRRLDPSTVKEVNDAILHALDTVSPAVQAHQALLKVHIGEPKCATRMRPEYAQSSVRFLREQGVEGIVAGDTTVAYSGPRGHRQNPAEAPRPYLELARKQGWSASGTTGVPFVVLDRPSTAISGRFEFTEEERRCELAGEVERFSDFFLAGGFAASDFVINHAHLTMHGLAGVAGCIKSLAMGCSSLRGKLRMHQSLLPDFDAEVCAACGQCVESCPENALDLPEPAPCPTVDPELCIGCGECEAVCVRRAVELRGEDIADWQRGEDTLPLRMTDYTMGLMAGRWESTVHVLHMVTITERCDCLDVRQKPMLNQDLGFLVGKNPFAIDLLAAERLGDALPPDRRAEVAPLLRSAERTAAHVNKAYGVVTETRVETLSLR